MGWWIKACLNGGRRPDEHPAVPVTAGQLAAAAAATAAEGAAAVHVHPRDAGDGLETLRADVVGAAVVAIREARPGLPVGVSTGMWIAAGDPDRRAAEVAGWGSLPSGCRPDFASVNVSEPGFVDLARVLRSAGIGVEAGVWSVADAAALARFPVERVLVEIIDAPAEGAVAEADAVLAALDDVESVAPRLLHGENSACWPLIRHSIRLGLPTRIGLEDVLVDPDGRPVDDNAHLIRLAVALRNRS